MSLYTLPSKPEYHLNYDNSQKKTIFFLTVLHRHQTALENITFHRKTNIPKQLLLVCAPQ